MDFLKKNWPLILIPIIGIILYFLLFKKASLSSNEKGLATNDDKYNPFNLYVEWNAKKDAVNYKAQGNGNVIEGTWTFERSQETMPPSFTGDGSTEIFNYDKESTDGDFYFSIRSVQLETLGGLNVMNQIIIPTVTDRYDIFGVWDTKTTVADPADPNSAKAVIKVDWLTKTITVVKSSSDKQV